MTDETSQTRPSAFDIIRQGLAMTPEFRRVIWAMIGAGVLLGLLAFKPHLAVVAPLMLLASGRWRAIAASAFTACALAHKGRNHDG